LELVEGIILKQINYKESSKIMYLYTGHGLVSVLVHGSQKIKSPYLNLVRVFSYVRLFVSGKTLKTLRDAEVLDRYPMISDKLERYAYGLHLMEVVYQFSGHDHDHKKLFQFLLKILERLNQDEQYESYVMMFELKLLYLLGLQPLLKHCVFCREETHLSFSVKDGGMVCQNHGGKKEYPSSTIQYLAKLYYFDVDRESLDEVNREDIKHLRKLLDAYYQYHLNFKSKSRKMIQDLLGY
jgi:DNA repair protein RecO (recombination protein O)